MIHHGDLFDVLPTLDAESIDACVTDPPYGLGFMSKEWDVPGGIGDFPMRRRVETDAVNTGASRQGGRQRSCADFQKRQARDARAFEADTSRWAAEVFRVLKPGAHILVFGGTRTFHRMASGIEDAGFEIRDCLSWLYGQGFPKSLNMGDGRGTALKPSWEPIILARKPTRGTVRANVETYGTGALNIDACRIATDGRPHIERRNDKSLDGHVYGSGINGSRQLGDFDFGRWPANVILDDLAAMVLDEQACEVGGGNKHNRGQVHGFMEGRTSVRDDVWDHADERGGASRFYYVAKPSREERDMGCYGLPPRTAGEATDRTDGSAGLNNPRAGAGRTGGARNIHPTVKPVELMRWLVRLITPPGGVVLDPFTGSGTTGMACRYELREFIGIEREAEYVAIAQRRIAAVAPLFESASVPGAVDPQVDSNTGTLTTREFEF